MRSSNSVLITIDNYLPGYKAGGPVRSIAQLVAELGREFRFRVVTLDRDFRAKKPFPGISVGQWERVGNAEVMYIRPGVSGLIALIALLRSVDRDTVLYLNSVFSRRFSMLAAVMRRLSLCRPRCMVVAPRGEFSDDAMRIKRRRKQLFLWISRALALYDDVLWHASSQLESADIRRHFPCAAAPSQPALREEPAAGLVLEASDIPAAFPKPVRTAKTAGALRIVFLSRVCRMKNLTGAITMLKGLSGTVTLDICGPIEDQSYWRKCQALAGDLPANVRVRYRGEIAPESVTAVMAEYDVFLLPTLGENFGHVVAEALAAGCPPLISDRTLWRGLEAAGVGWDLPLEKPERFRATLQQCIEMDEPSFSRLSRAAVAYAQRRAADPAVAEANRKLLLVAESWPLASQA